MRAMVMTDFGASDVFELQDVPDPACGPQDLLLDVKASAVNPVDCKTRLAPRWGDRQPPMILGFDVSGIVLDVGSDVQGFSVGDEVMASPSLLRDGANAERVCIDARSAAAKPTSLSHEEAAALPLVTLTAWESVFKHGRVRPGDNVLIHAAAGGVGHIALQLCKEHGCRTIVTAGKPESVALCQSLGADVIIHYRDENVTDRVMAETNGEGCPMVFDTVGGEVFAESVGLVALDGRLVTIVPGIPTDNLNSLFGKNASLHFEFMGSTLLNGRDPSHQSEILQKATEMVEAGTLKPVVEKVWELDQLAEAHVRQESQRSVGKQVIRVG